MGFQILAGVLFAVFYIVYYGKQVMMRKKGITTNQLAQQKQGREKWIAQGMGLATLAVCLGDLAAIAWNITGLPVWARWAGAVVAALGDLVFYLSVHTIGDSWRAGVSSRQETDLVTGGIYSVSRNPAFLGFYLHYIGLLLLFFSWWLLALTVLAIVFLHLQIIWVEEPFLPKTFGKAYTDYAAHTGRYFGRK